MNMIKKLSLALIFAAVAVFSASAAEKCGKACAEGKKGCPVQITRDVLKAKGAALDEKSSNNIFEWWTKGASRYLVYVGKLNEGGKVKYVPTTVYSVTIPYDGVCNPGRQMMMYHPEGYSKGILNSKATIKLVIDTPSCLGT